MLVLNTGTGNKNLDPEIPFCMTVRIFRFDFSYIRPDSGINIKKIAFFESIMVSYFYTHNRKIRFFKKFQV
jgi:hypothetical protein